MLHMHYLITIWQQTLPPPVLATWLVFGFYLLLSPEDGLLKQNVQRQRRLSVATTFQVLLNLCVLAARLEASRLFPGLLDSRAQVESRVARALLRLIAPSGGMSSLCLAASASPSFCLFAVAACRFARLQLSICRRSLQKTKASSISSSELLSLRGAPAAALAAPAGCSSEELSWCVGSPANGVSPLLVADYSGLRRQQGGKLAVRKGCVNVKAASINETLLFGAWLPTARRRPTLRVHQPRGRVPLRTIRSKRSR